MDLKLAWDGPGPEFDNNNICSGPGFPQRRVFTLRSGNQAHLTLCPVLGSDSLLSASWLVIIVTHALFVMTRSPRSHVTNVT